MAVLNGQRLVVVRICFWTIAQEKNVSRIGHVDKPSKKGKFDESITKIRVPLGFSRS